MFIVSLYKYNFYHGKYRKVLVFKRSGVIGYEYIQYVCRGPLEKVYFKANVNLYYLPLMF